MRRAAGRAPGSPHGRSIPEREIEEILRQAGETAPPASHSPKKVGLRRLIWSHVKQSFAGKPLSISPGRAMLAAVLLLLAALVLNSVGFGPVAFVALAGLILFIVAYGMFFIRPPKAQKRWRGQVIQIEEESSRPWWDRFRRPR